MENAILVKVKHQGNSREMQSKKRTSPTFLFSSALSSLHQPRILGEGTEFQCKYLNTVLELMNLSHVQKENRQKFARGQNI